MAHAGEDMEVNHSSEESDPGDRDGGFLYCSYVSSPYRGGIAAKISILYTHSLIMHQEYVCSPVLIECPW